MNLYNTLPCTVDLVTLQLESCPIMQVPSSKLTLMFTLFSSPGFTLRSPSSSRGEYVLFPIDFSLSVIGIRGVDILPVFSTIIDVLIRFWLGPILSGTIVNVGGFCVALDVGFVRVAFSCGGTFLSGSWLTTSKRVL